MKKLLVIAAVAAFQGLAARTAAAKTVGIWKGDARAEKLTGALTSLSNAGWRVTWFSREAELCDEKKLAETDALLFTGGWQAYFFPGTAARERIVRYAAGGKGVLLGLFRSGYTRTANRPMFPEIGAAENRVNGGWVYPVGSNALARAFRGETLTFGSRDHIVMKVGPKGEVFAASGEDPVGVCGEVGLGRVCAFGIGFGYRDGEPDHDAKERIFLTALDWLASAPRRDALTVRAAEDAAAVDFLRREAVWSWTLRTRGPDRGPGVIPALRDEIVGPVEGREFTLEYLARFLSGTCRQECLDCAAELKRAATAIRRTCESACADAERRLNGLSSAAFATAAATRANPAGLDAEALRRQFERLVPQAAMERAARLTGIYRPLVKSLKAQVLAEERAADAAAVPALLARFAAASTNLTETGARERRALALELGRIGDARAAQALVGALDDSVSEVRSQAAVSLGWMQARAAVPALLAKLKSDDPFLRRRAVQALGAIGDARAVAPLLLLLKDLDGRLSVGTALALGWLKARQAVEPLIAIAKDAAADRHLRSAAARALGEIGDARAKRPLEELAALEHDEPNGSLGALRGGGRTNPLTTCQGRGVRLNAQKALDLLAGGGRRAPGVRQPPELAAKDRFYAITRRCNSFASRAGVVMDAPGMGLNMWAYLADAGATGYHNAWGTPGMSAETYAAHVREAAEFDLNWIEVMPFSEMPDDYEYVISGFEELGVTTLAGFWSEETFPSVTLTGEQFERAIERRHGADWRKALALKPGEEPRAVAKWSTTMEAGTNAFAIAAAAGRLRGEFLERALEVSADAWRETQEWMRGRWKGCAFTYSFSNADPVRYVGTDRFLDTVDCPGPECYQSFGRYNAFVMEKWRNGETRPVMAEFYNWYGKGHETDLRGFWQNAVHGKCFYNFCLNQIFSSASREYLWLWDATRWDDFRSVFRRVRDHADCYEISPSATDVALVGSERSAVLFKHMRYYQVPILVRHEQNLLAKFVAIQQLHRQADVLYAEHLTAEKLAKYRVIVLANAKTMTEGEIAVLREWVRAGGTLVAEGTTTLFDPATLEMRANYALADVFGVDWRETVFPAADRHDTLAYDFRSGSAASPFRTGFAVEDRAHLEDYVWRDVKPVRSVLKATAADGSVAECDAALGYDRVKPVTAKVLATFPGGDPAVLENAFGRGRCVFRTSGYPELAHVTSRWEMMPNRFTFWPGVTESLEKAFAGSGSEPRVTLAGADGEVAVTCYDQPERNRLVVHLLDYDATRAKVSGVKLSVAGARPIRRVWYPDAKGELKVKDRTVALRAFHAYDMLAVEFGEDRPQARTAAK